MADKAELLKNVFGYKPVNPAPVAPAVGPDQITPEQMAQVAQAIPGRKYTTRDSVSRDSISPEIVANVQAQIWGTGNVPPPKGPTAKMMDTGTSPAMKQESGWGKV